MSAVSRSEKGARWSRTVLKQLCTFPACFSFVPCVSCSCHVRFEDEIDSSPSRLRPAKTPRALLRCGFCFVRTGGATAFPRVKVDANGKSVFGMNYVGTCDKPDTLQVFIF